MHRVVGGLERLEPGWRRTRIAPRPGGGLTSARAVHDTVHGRLSCAWRLVDGRVEVDVAVPAGTTAQVVLPLDPEGRTLEVGPGEHAWRYDLAVGALPGGLHLDSLVQDVQAEPAAWAAVREVLLQYFPGTPVDAAGAHLAEQPLRALAVHAGVRSADMERDLQAALDAPR